MSMDIRKFLKKFNMKKIYKIINIALIFMLGYASLWIDSTYSSDVFHLRVPIGINQMRAVEAKNILDEDQEYLSSKADFKDIFLSMIESCEVDSYFCPKFSDTDLESLIENFQKLEHSEKSKDFLKKGFKIFSHLYARPDINANEIMRMHSISKNELLEVFKFIQDSDALQELFYTHPIHQLFFREMEELLKKPAVTLSILNGIQTYPLKLELHTSEKQCPFNCLFCFNNGHSFYEKTRKGISSLNLEDWEKLIEEATKGGVTEFPISGGFEPLNSLEKTVAIIEKIRKYNANAVIFTDGLCIDPENKSLIDALLSLNHIYISIRGGNEKEHDRITRTKNTFSKVINGMDFLIQERKRINSITKISVSIVVAPETPRVFPEIIELVSMRKPDSIKLRVFIGREHGLTLEQQIKLGRELIDLAADPRFKETELDLDPPLQKFIFLAKKEGHLSRVYQYELKMFSAETAKKFSPYIKPVISPFGDVFSNNVVANPIFEDLIKHWGTVGNGVSLKEVLDRTKKTPEMEDGSSMANYQQNNIFRALEKLDIDLKNGIPLDKQPFNPFLMRQTLEEKLKDCCPKVEI